MKKIIKHLSLIVIILFFTSCGSLKHNKNIFRRAISRLNRNKNIFKNLNYVPKFNFRNNYIQNRGLYRLNLIFVDNTPKDSYKCSNISEIRSLNKKYSSNYSNNNYCHDKKHIHTALVCAGSFLFLSNLKFTEVKAENNITKYHTHCPSCKKALNVPADCFETENYNLIIAYAERKCIHCKKLLVVKNPEYTEKKNIVSYMPIIGSFLNACFGVFEGVSERDTQKVAKALSGYLYPEITGIIDGFIDIPHQVGSVYKHFYIQKTNWILKAIEELYDKEYVFELEELKQIIKNDDYFFDFIVKEHKKKYGIDISLVRNSLDEECKEFIDKIIEDVYILYSDKNKMPLKKFDKIFNKIVDTFIPAIETPHKL